MTDGIARNIPDRLGGGRWNAVVLAGQRPEGDPLAEHYGHLFKALVPVNGVSMLARVTAALRGSERIGRIIILAQEPEALLTGDAAQLSHDPELTCAVSTSGIASSLSAIISDGTVDWPILVTTADHALLTSQMVDDFLQAAAAFELAVGVGARSIVEQAFPTTRRTWLKFSDDHYSGANLFGLRGPGVMRALDLWADVEKDRKKGWKILSRFGPWLFIRAITRSIRFPDALAQAGRRLGIQAGPVIMAQAESVIDVDKPSDLELAEKILSKRAVQGKGVVLAEPAGE